MSGLVSFFRDRQEVVSGGDNLSQAINAFLNGKEDGESLLILAANDCLTLPLDTPEDILYFYRCLTSILFMRKEENPRLDNVLDELVLKGETKGFWKGFQLEEGYRVLAHFLYTGKKKDFTVKHLEKGAVLQENGMHVLDRHFPNPRENGELALICLYLGWKWFDEDLMQVGLNLAGFCLSLCDHEGKLFQGLWLRESEYRSSGLTQIFSLLFSLASHVALSSKIQVVAETLLEEKEKSPPHLMIALFAKAFDHLIESEIPFPKGHDGYTLYDHDQSLGFLRYEGDTLSFVCSASGANTGLGVLHKKGVYITSFGPHYAPLADSSGYGIFRPSNGSRDGFKDIEIETGSDKARIKGWTRVVAPVATHVANQSYSIAQAGKQWLFFDLQGMEDSASLLVRQSVVDQENPLYFVFFISADRAIIEGEAEILPKGIERFQGRANKILFRKNADEIKISPQFEGEMAVIPLAGSDHFWSADFLLAFPLTEKMSAYQWNIE